MFTYQQFFNKMSSIICHILINYVFLLIHCRLKENKKENGELPQHTPSPSLILRHPHFLHIEYNYQFCFNISYTVSNVHSSLVNSYSVKLSPFLYTFSFISLLGVAVEILKSFLSFLLS